MKYELVIFDCDGVLIDSEYLTCQIDLEAVNQLGHTLALEDYMDVAVGCISQEVDRKLFERFKIKIPPNFWPKVELGYQKEFEERLLPIKGVKELIQGLKVPYCVASSSDAARLELTLTLAGLISLVQGRVYGRECVQHAKPAPDIFLYAAEQMGIAPSKCLVIEDSIHGIQAAQKAGMDVWAFCGGKH